MFTRTIIGYIFCATVLALSSSAVAQEKEKEFIPGSDTNFAWAEDYAEAVSIAKSKYLPILAYFYGNTNLELCKLAETEIFKKSEIKSLAKKFSCVKIDSTRNKELCKKYGVNAGEFAIILLSPQEKEIEQIRGKEALTSLQETLKKIAEEYKKPAELHKKLEKSYKQAIERRKSGDTAAAIRILEDILSYADKIESQVVKEAEKALADIEKEANKLLTEAEQDTQEAETAARTGDFSKIKGDPIGRAQQKLDTVARDYPLSSIKSRLEAAQSRLKKVNEDYQRRAQEAGQGKK